MGACRYVAGRRAAELGGAQVSPRIWMGQESRYQGRERFGRSPIRPHSLPVRAQGRRTVQWDAGGNSYRVQPDSVRRESSCQREDRQPSRVVFGREAPAVCWARIAQRHVSPHGGADEDKISSCRRSRVRRDAVRTPPRPRRVKVWRVRTG